MNLGLLIQPTKTPDSSMKVFQTELSDQPSETVTLSGQTTAVFTGPGTLMISYTIMTVLGQKASTDLP